MLVAQAQEQFLWWTGVKAPQGVMRAAAIRRLLRQIVDGGGTVVLSSHVMEVVERMCDHVAVIDRGRVVAAGPLDVVKDGSTLEDRFVDLVGARPSGADLSWIGT